MGLTRLTDVSLQAAVFQLGFVVVAAGGSCGVGVGGFGVKLFAAALLMLLLLLLLLVMITVVVVDVVAVVSNRLSLGYCSCYWCCWW